MELFSSLTGSAFLLVYGALLALGSALAYAIPQLWRGAGRRGEISDFESAALLAGGPTRLADAVLADLYLRGGLEARDGNRLAVARRDIAARPAGKAVLALEGQVTAATACRALAIEAEWLTARLRRGGLLLWPEDHLRLRWLSVAPLLAVLLLGLVRLRAEMTEGNPVGPLVGALGATGVAAALRFFQSDQRTRSGLALVEAMRQRHGKGIGGARGEAAAMAVALYGTSVLVGTPWEPLHVLRQPGDGGSSHADGGSGDWGDSDCDSGGGDGGGCGD